MTRLARLFLAIPLLTFFTFIPASASDETGMDQYWQQDVNYSINIMLADDLRTITGSSEIEYVNNSPDTLKVIYLKAFANAIQKGSYADLKNRKTKDWSLADLKPEQEGRTEIQSIVRGSESLSFDMDNTIVTVYLSRPILPHSTSTFTVEFTVVLPQPANMRMGVTGGTTRAAYWHPAVCVYDRKLGWVNSQYLGWGEWYGDYGKFDVRITAPEDQIVAATGVCVNESEMIPPVLREKLDISNFLKARPEWPEFDFDDTKIKTWHYVAENVPDFVFTNSSNWCIDADTVEGVEVIAYALRWNAANWTEAVRLGMESVVTHGENFIPYQWPVVRICDAYGGMEYPMLTNCSNRRGPDSKFFAMLIYHEVGHFWFMGHIGSSQTDRPFLDEGFTTHAEHLAMEKYLGRLGNFEHHDTWFQKKFYPQSEDRNIRGFTPLLLLMKDGYDKEMVFSYDQGDEYWPFRVSAYYKTAAMHYSLTSILGEELYFKAMQHYCRKWLFKHPYEEDFVIAMEEGSGVELSEYLRQWFHRTDRIDYAFAGMDTDEETDSWSHRIKLKRLGDFVVPIDVAVVWEQGDTTFYTVPPENMEYAKPGHILLPVWNQFRRDDREYEFVTKARRQIKKVVIDPYELLMDINRLNNASGLFPPIELRIDNLVYDRPPINAYQWRLRPDFWYDDPNGFQFGVHSHGAFLEDIAKHDIEARVGTDSWRPYLDFYVASPFEPIGRYSTAYHHLVRADRRTYFSAGFSKRFKERYSVLDQDLLILDMNSMAFDKRVPNRLFGVAPGDDKYMNSPHWFATNTYNLATTFASVRTFRHGSFGWEFNSTQGFFEEDFDYRGYMTTGIKFDLGLQVPLDCWLDLNLQRTLVIGDPPPQYLPQLSRMSGVETFVGSSVFRSPGTFPDEWADDFYLANDRARGYQDRNIFFTRAYSGSLSLTTPDWLPYSWLRKIPLVGNFLSRANQALFVDAALLRLGDNFRYPITGNELEQSDTKYTTYLSAGVSLAFPSIWDGQTVRLDFPLYLNEPITGEGEFDFRFSVAWILPGYFD